MYVCILLIIAVYQTCRLWGDPHQITFDTYGYTHQGDAEYIAVTTCFNEDESVPNFEIVVDNFRKKPSIPVTYIREHRLYYNNVVYALTHPDDVSVDGERVTLPYIDAENGIKIHYAAPHKASIYQTPLHYQSEQRLVFVLYNILY